MVFFPWYFPFRLLEKKIGVFVAVVSFSVLLRTLWWLYVISIALW